MKRTVAALALGAATLLAGCGAPADSQAPAGPGATAPAGTASVEPASAPPAEARPGTTVTLYFPDASGSLTAEPRELADMPVRPERAETLVRATLEALLAGPRGGLERVIPPAATLRAAYLDEEGTAYVDMDAAFARGLSAGSDDALLAIASIANSLAVSVPEVRRVRLMIEGEEVRDLGGHLDLTRPILPDLATTAAR